MCGCLPAHGSCLVLKRLYGQEHSLLGLKVVIDSQERLLSLLLSILLHEDDGDSGGGDKCSASDIVPSVRGATFDLDTATS